MVESAGVAVLAVAAVLGGMALLALAGRRARRAGTAGRAIAAAMAAYDEAMHVTAFDAFVEVRQEDERGAAAAFRDAV
ncbi:hypothetical protein [Amnibacterium sp.]|uniref:hypothetical protein n=1 Tax=Amnibacterium sp. TaxID=1872496 RepID=UPI002606ADC1|nr:hypothetical protein [Amnibacterium sp.]MCU1474444.1 hypothetical protein [Amnibacterium sp.]